MKTIIFMLLVLGISGCHDEHIDVFIIPNDFEGRVYAFYGYGTSDQNGSNKENVARIYVDSTGIVFTNHCFIDGGSVYVVREGGDTLEYFNGTYSGNETYYFELESTKSSLEDSLGNSLYRNHRCGNRFVFGTFFVGKRQDEISPIDKSIISDAEELYKKM